MNSMLRLNYSSQVLAPWNEWTEGRKATEVKLYSGFRAVLKSHVRASSRKYPERPKMVRLLLLVVSAVLLISQVNSQAVCPRIYQPVCCKLPTSAVPNTKDNSCRCATEQKGIVLYAGKCKPDEGIGCAFLFQPVCCLVIGDYRPATAGNDCTCKYLKKGIVLYTGACQALPRGGTRQPPQACTMEFAPVCCRAKDAARARMVANTCFCGTGAVLYTGRCKARDRFKRS